MPMTARKKKFPGIENTVYNIPLMYTVFCALSYVKMTAPVL